MNLIISCRKPYVERLLSTLSSWLALPIGFWLSAEDQQPYGWGDRSINSMQEKFFRRDDALALLAGIVTRPNMPRMLAVAEAIKTAQSFEEQMRNSGQSDSVAMPKAFAEVAYGEFLPYDDLLYFQSNDGTRLLVAKYASMQIATAMAIAFNSFLEVSEQVASIRRPNWASAKDNNSGIEL